MNMTTGNRNPNQYRESTVCRKECDIWQETCVTFPSSSISGSCLRFLWINPSVFHDSGCARITLISSLCSESHANNTGSGPEDGVLACDYTGVLHRWLGKVWSLVSVELSTIAVNFCVFFVGLFGNSWPHRYLFQQTSAVIKLWGVMSCSWQLCSSLYYLACHDVT